MTNDGAKKGRPAARNMLSSQVKDRILQWILEGELVPGSRVVETRVAREMEVSQSPVREAIRDLAALGFLEIDPYRGARVRRFTRKEFVEDMEIRGELEAMAARRAATRITPTQVAELEELVEEMRRLAMAADVHGQALKNTEFHRSVVRASGSSTLERLWLLLEPFARTYVTAMVPGIDLVWLGDRHNSIVEALKAGDPDQAARAMLQHSEEARELVTAIDEARFRVSASSTSGDDDR
jgi:DNA-binding GntR family transcriptional regulator